MYRSDRTAVLHARFFRIIVKSVRVLLVATDKNTVIHYLLSQPLRVAVRSLIPFPIIMPVQPHGFQQADEVAGDDVECISYKDHVAIWTDRYL